MLQREAALRLAGGGRFAASWAPWFELAVHGRIPARAFRPTPSVDSAILTIVPRPIPLLSPAAYPDYDAFLRAASAAAATRSPAAWASARPRSTRSGCPRDATPGSIPPESYARVFQSVVGSARYLTYGEGSP